jgi:hypothetical protein
MKRAACARAALVVAALVSTSARAQAPWPACQVDGFSINGTAVNGADPTFNGNAATPAMRLRRGGTCSVGILGPHLSMSVITQASNGTAQIDDQRISYNARPGFVGDDTFTVRMFSADRSVNNTAFLTFRVQVREAVPQPPAPSPENWRATATSKAEHQSGSFPRTATPRPARPPTQMQAPAVAAPSTAQPAAPAAQPAGPRILPAPAAASNRPAAPDAARPDIAARLRQLQSLHDQNLITDEEYRTRRQQILDSL